MSESIKRRLRRAQEMAGPRANVKLKYRNPSESGPLNYKISCRTCTTRGGLRWSTEYEHPEWLGRDYQTTMDRWIEHSIRGHNEMPPVVGTSHFALHEVQQRRQIVTARMSEEKAELSELLNALTKEEL